MNSRPQLSPWRLELNANHGLQDTRVGNRRVASAIGVRCADWDSRRAEPILIYQLPRRVVRSIRDRYVVGVRPAEVDCVVEIDEVRMVQDIERVHAKLEVESLFYRELLLN